MNQHRRTLTLLAFHFDGSMMEHHNFLDDRKAQAVTADAAVSRQICFIKPIKHIIQLLWRYSNARIRYRDENFVL